MLNIDNNREELAPNLKDFVARTDCYGEWNGEKFVAIKSTLTPTKLAEHKQGKKTIGVYTIDPLTQTCKYFCADLDAHDEPKPENLAIARAIAKDLSNIGLNPFIEDSNGNGGYHIWCVFKTRIAATDACSLGEWIRSNHPECEETFPKQRSIALNGYGNFVRLPEGKHHKRNHTSRYLSPPCFSNPSVIPDYIKTYAEPSTRRECYEKKTHTSDWDWLTQYSGDLSTLDIVGLCDDRIIRYSGNHCYEIDCPWASTHTTGDNSAFVWEAREGHKPSFYCHHAHCSEKRLKDLLSLYPVERVDTFCKKTYQREEDIQNKKIEEMFASVSVEDARSTLETPASKSPSDFPEIVDLDDFLDTPMTLPKELIKGILHKGSKMVIGGTSKGKKTWTFLDLACAVGSGQKWLSFQCEKGKVLYVNFEIQQEFMRKRYEYIASVRKLTTDDRHNIKLWNLRGYSAAYQTMLPRLQKATEDKTYDLIIIDPIYKLYGGTDENSARDVAALMNGLEQIATKNQVAIVFGAHFAKGDASQKSAIDRISGSGVFARDPDTILVFTAHAEDDCCAVDAVVRNCPPVVPFVVKWEFPQWNATTYSPKDLKTPSTKYNVGMFMEAYNKNPNLKAVIQELGCSQGEYYNLRRKAQNAGKVK